MGVSCAAISKDHQEFEIACTMDSPRKELKGKTYYKSLLNDN